MVRSTVALLFLIAVLIPVSGAAGDPGEECGARLVPVREGVELEVLDWGGEGQTMVLLAGLGNTTHVYAKFAHQFTDRHHVLGITRRGFGASSAPAEGYDIGTLAADVLAVLDRLELDAVVLVGHSIAGEEMTAIALEHPGRILALVYLDAAQDRSDHEALQAQLDRPAPLAFAPADGSSLRHLNGYLARARGWRVPLCELEALYSTDDEGAVVGFHGEATATEQIQAGLAPADVGGLDVPALAIFAGPTLQGLFPAHRGYDETDLAKAVRCVEILARRASRDAERFAARVSGGEVVILEGANHHLFLTHEGDVVREMRRFLADVAAARE